MIDERKRRQGAFPWIRYGFMLFCGILVVSGSYAGVVQANQLYTAAVPYFSDDLDTGTGNQPPTVLIVVYGETDIIEQRLKPAVANLNDFNPYPEGNLQLSPDLGAAGIPLIVPEGAMDAVATDYDTVDVEDLSRLTFAPIEDNTLLMMHPGDLLVFAMRPTDIRTIQPTVSERGIVLAFKIESLGSEESAIPEVSSLLLFGIGLLGMLGLGLRRGGTRK